MNPFDQTFSRRRFLSSVTLGAGAVATGAGSWVFPTNWANAAAGPIKVGIATDLTGPLGNGGNSAVITARAVTKQINDGGGVLGRPIELHIEDTGSNESVGVGNVRKLIQRDQVDVVIGGISSAMRNAIKDIIITRGKTLYIYPTLYEGKECTPHLFCTGPTPAQLCDDLIPWLTKSGAKRFALTGSNYIFPRTLFEYAKKVIARNGGEVAFEEYYPLDQLNFGAAVSGIMSSKSDVVLVLVIPPGLGPLFKQLHEAGFTRGGGRLACPFFDETAAALVQPNEMEGTLSSLDYFSEVAATDPASARIDAAFQAEKQGPFRFSASSGATGTYRALKLWEAAVKEAGSLERDAVSSALDHAKIAEGPGGPAEMVPGKHHCRMRMYTAVAKQGKFEIVSSSPGLVDPQEC